MIDYMQTIHLSLLTNLSEFTQQDQPILCPDNNNAAWECLVNKTNIIFRLYARQLDEATNVMRAVTAGDICQRIESKEVTQVNNNEDDSLSLPPRLEQLKCASDEMGKIIIIIIILTMPFLQIN